QTRGTELRVVRTALPLTSVVENVAHLRRLLLAGLLAAALLGLAAALLVSRRLLRRIQRLVDFARTLASGAPAPYLAPERRDDLGVLEEQLAEMAREVATTIAALRVERERLEAILRGMVEGVVVIDLAGNVVLMNDRARDLLDVPAGHDGRGQPLIGIARQPRVADMLRALARGAAMLSSDAIVGGDGPTLQVNGARLCGPDGAPFGFVLVLHARDRGRCRPLPTGADQPGRQRDQVLAARRPGDRPRGGGPRGAPRDGRGGGRGHRHRHPGPRPSPADRALLPRRQGPLARARRH